MTSARLRTADGVPIDAHHDAGPPGGGLAVVVAHGFTGSWRRPAIRRVAAVLAPIAAVVSFDFRGHGRSGGLSTVGDLEVHDLQSAVEWARSLGYVRVATLGFSMGAAVALRHAALQRGVSAVAAVSGPGHWYYRGTVAMRRAHWVIETPHGRTVGRLALRTRVSPHGWEPVPMPPDEAAAVVTPAPLLIVHGDADRYFPVAHAQRLYAAAGEPKHLWLEAGFGHAENAAPAPLLARIGTWLAEHAAAWAYGAEKIYESS